MSSIATKSDLEAMVKRREMRLVKKAGRITYSALRAPEVPEEVASLDTLAKAEWAKAHGMSDVELRIALDANKDNRSAPYYLKAAVTVMDTAKELAKAGRQPAAIAVQIIINGGRTYAEPIDVTPID